MFRQLVYQSIVRSGNEDDWFYLFEKAKTIETEQTRILVSLASTKDFCLLK